MKNTPDLESLRKALKGKVILPGDKEYDDQRKMWNGMVDRRPSLIVQCMDESDVIQAVNFGRENNLLTAVRGGGHNVAGLGTCDDGMMIDLSLMKSIRVDKESSTAYVQGGATWGDFDQATQPFALSSTGGLVSTTGVGGFTLGGGIGWLLRKYGLTVDNLLEVEMVLASGEKVKANTNDHADLFWAIRGGGGNFGIVTTFVFRLNTVGPEVYGGALFYPASEAPEILRFYRDWIKSTPEELTTLIALATAPPEPFIPAQYQGTSMIAVALCYSGKVEEGEAVIKPLRDFKSPAIDLAAPVPYINLQQMFDGSVPKGIRSYWRSENLPELNDDIVRVLCDMAFKIASPFSAVHIHHLEGAVKKTDNDAMAYASRDTPFILNVIAAWMDPPEDEKHIGWVKDFSREISPFISGKSYLNFMGNEGENRVKAAFGEKKYARLVEIKNKYDPQNFFRVNQNIKPSS